MRNLFLLTVAFIFILGGTAYGNASSIAVIQSTDDIINPEVKIVSSGSNSTSMRIEISSIAKTETEVAGNRFDKISISDEVDLIRSTTGEIGKPELPLHTTTLAIPDRGGIEIRINSSSYEVIENVDIAPVQAPIHEGEDESGVLTIDNDVYSTDAFYPREIVWANEPFVIRDFRGAGIVYCPVQYNPVTRQLRVYNNIDFDVVYTDEDAPNPAPARKQYISEAFKPLYESLFDNYDEVCADLPSKRGGYLIITHEMFYDSLLEFASWKHRKGYDVHLVPLTEIASNPSAYNIFEYIESAYNNWEIAPEFILLVGDVTMPGGKRFPDYSYSYYTSDYPYGCVVGDDYFQDIMVSRIAIDTELELSKIMTKTLTYEQYPEEMEDGWMDRGLSVGCNAGGWGPIPTTPRLTTLWVRQKLFDNGFSQCDTCFYWSGGPYCQPSVITASLNRGTNIVSYRGLAGPSGWACPDYYYYDLNTLNNGYRGAVMISIVCGSGHYGSSTDPCFGEAWLRGGYGSDIRGGVVFYGTTDTDTHTRWNNPLMVGLYWGLFDEDLTHFAQAVYRGKLLQYAVFPQHTQPYGTVELYFHTYN
ncbi:MAG: hypothetical protein GF307_10275, partial [candidate division Zixibacteria bacterium]|nr:hypothetical protein [candidate division Zixibacteria bacterium]